MINFAGKTVLVTGAGGAIGRATAQLFCELNANLALTDLDMEALRRTKESLPRSAASAICVRHAAASTADAELATQAALTAFGGLDVVVTIAGVLRKCAFVETDDSSLAATMAVNFHGVFATCRAAARALGEGGCIATVASLAGHTGRAGLSAYAASKGAVLALTKSLAEELAPDVRVNAVSPGFIASEMSSAVIAENPRLAEGVPLRRLGTAAEVAQAIAFLCSDSASYISGQVLHVNGGLYSPG